MNIDLRPFLVLWALLLAVVITMVFYRIRAAQQEDDSIHLMAGAAARQEALARRLARIDKWGKTLTVIAVIAGLLLLGVWAYQSFLQHTTAGA